MVTLRVNNCCECFGLRSGSLYIAVLYMVIGIFNIVMTIIGLASAGGEVARYGRITTDGTLVLLCILLLIGVLKSEYSLCIMWVVGAVVWSVLTIVFGQVATIYAGKKTDVHSVTNCGWSCYGNRYWSHVGHHGTGNPSADLLRHCGVLPCAEAS
ncbi:uncharacterized protein LOC144883938 [Branchiostoma floridae x Branchiostoma japonicum]